MRSIYLMLAVTFLISSCGTENKIEELQRSGDCREAERLIKEDFSGQAQLYRRAILFIECDNDKKKGIQALQKLASSNYLPALERLIELDLATKSQHKIYSDLKEASARAAKQKKLERIETLSRIGRGGSGALSRQKTNSNGSNQSQPTTTCFSTGEYTSGFNKICNFDCLGSAHATTIDATGLCPLTVDR
jgi:hypothetical protein